MRDYSVLNGMIENQKSELRTAYDKGYNQGVKDTDFQLAISKRQDEAYKQGLHDAWECMKKICRIIPVDDFAKVFGDERVKNLCDIIMYISPAEAIEKVKEYDEKHFDVPDNCKIEVGDVCRYQTCKRIFIITSINEGFGGEEYFDAIYSNGEAIKNGKLSVIEKINGECVDKLENIFSALINICISGKADA